MRRPSRGFTIIEVIIVLVIGALIFLAVLKGAQTLQLNQRNVSRKNDEQKIAAQVLDFYISNNKQLPGQTGRAAPTDCIELLNSAGTMAQFSFSSCAAADQTATIPTAPVAGHFYIATAQGSVGYLPTYSTPVNNVMMLADNVRCNGASGLYPATANRSAALVYSIEVGDNFTWFCETVQ